MLMVSWTFLRFTPFGVDRFFRRAQFVSASLYALGHGGNDAQKTMGIIAVLLYSQGYLGAQFHVPFWVVLACQAAMAARHAGRRLADREDDGIEDHPADADAGLLRETGGSIMLFAATELGIPVSTTHTITGCIIGVGAAKRVVGGALERRQGDRHRLDHHHPGGRTDRGAVLSRGGLFG